MKTVLPDHYQFVYDRSNNLKWNRSRALDYYEVFKNQSNKNSELCWQRIHWIKNAKPGDVVAYTFKNGDEHADTGHVFFIYSDLRKISGRNEYTFDIFDSTSKKHGTRDKKGLGIGTGRIRMGVATDSEDGRYGRYIRWYDKDGYKNFYEIKIARPVSCDSAEPGMDIVGSDKDEHGCIGSAGYTWNEESNQCVRAWEVNSTS